MLKLEKNGKTHELRVLLRTKPTFFSGPFLYALAYALLIHLGALFIFKISPFVVNYQQSVFPPVRVATEMPIQHGMYPATLQSEEQEPIPSYLIAPLPSTPHFPNSYKMLSTLANSESIELTASSILNNPFLQDNEMDSSQYDSIDDTYQLLTYHLSGTLAELSLTLVDHQTTELLPRDTYYAIFAVHINQSDGHIFWWEMKEMRTMKENSNEQKLQNEAIEALKNLKLEFTQQDTSDILSGEIEIVMVPQYIQEKEAVLE